MIHDDFDTQIQCDELFNEAAAWEELEQAELDFVNAELDLAAEIQLAAEVEENYEHHDYRDELFEDEFEMAFDEDNWGDIVDPDTSFDDMLDGFNRFDDQRDLDFYES